MSASTPLGSVYSDLLGAWRISRLGAAGRQPAHPASGRFMPVIASHPQLVTLASTLYDLWFCRRVDAFHWTASATAMDIPTVPPLLFRLRAAHAATGRFEAGWIVRAVGATGSITAEKDGEQLRLLPPDYISGSRTARPVRAGDPILVTARRDGFDADNGWWVTYAGAARLPEAHIARVYWNCPYDSVDELVAGVTGMFESNRVPYSMKCPAHAKLFDRADAVVIYFTLENWRWVKDGLREVHSTLAARLREPVPPLTLRLGRGIAFAQDPGNGRSFGQSRALAVADGILRAREAHLSDEGAIVTAILDRFRAHGILPDRPHLQADSPAEIVSDW